VPLKIRTHRGEFTIDDDQLFCIRPCKVNTPEGEVDGSEILISLGCQPRRPSVVMANLERTMAEQRGAGGRIIIPPPGSKVDS
jgi:hypothetical protein